MSAHAADTVRISIDVYLGSAPDAGETVRAAFCGYPQFQVNGRDLQAALENPQSPSPDLIIAHTSCAETGIAASTRAICPLILIGAYSELATYVDLATAVVPTDPAGEFTELLPNLVRQVLHLQERQETQQDLVRKSEQRHEDLLNAIPDIVYRLSPEGYFLYVNDAIRTLGYEPEELIGRHFTILLSEEQIQVVSRQQVLERMAGIHTGRHDAPKLLDERRSGDRSTRGLEVRLIPKGARRGSTKIGSVVAYGEVTATGFYQTNGGHKHFVGTVGIIQDITLQRKSERLLRNLASAVDQTRTAFCIVTASGTIEYANGAFASLHGLREYELPGKIIFDLGIAYFAGDKFRRKLDHLEIGDAIHDEAINTTASGERMWVAVKVSPVVEPNGSVGRFIIEQEDVTKTKQRFLRQMEALREKDAVVHELHHRVRNNLQLISSLVNLQSLTHDDDHVVPALARLAGRVQALSHVQDTMYAAGNYNAVNLGVLIRNIVHAWSSERDSTVHFTEKGDCPMLGVAFAVPVALLLQELLELTLRCHRENDAVTIHRRAVSAAQVISVSFSGPDVMEQRNRDPQLDESITLVEVLSQQVNATLRHGYEDTNWFTVTYYPADRGLTDSASAPAR